MRNVNQNSILLFALIMMMLGLVSAISTPHLRSRKLAKRKGKKKKPKPPQGKMKVEALQEEMKAETMQEKMDDSKPFEDDGNWIQLRAALCPKMVPNVTLAKETLFSLARKKLGFSTSFMNHLTKERDPSNDIYQRFYDFHIRLYPYTGELITDSDKQGKEQKYNVMAYVSIWKCGNNQIRFGMRDTLPNFFDVPKFYPHFFSEFVQETTTYHPPCLITAIRDPISHFISGYNEVENRYRHNFEAENESFSFTQYARGSQKRFEAFVAYFLSAPNLSRMIPYNPDYPQLPHVYLMSGILVELATYNLTLTDYMPSLHNLTWTWPQFMKSTCPNITFPDSFGTTTPMSFTGQHNDDKRYQKAGIEVLDIGGPTAQALCILHVMDYACFDKLHVPLVCQKVYEDKNFIQAIISYNEGITEEQLVFNSALKSVNDLPIEPDQPIVFWHIPRTSGTSLNKILAGCLDLTLANQRGIINHENDSVIKVIQFAGKAKEKVVNVDTTTIEGIAHAKELGLVSSGLADVIIAPRIYDALDLFDNAADGNKGRLFTIMRHPVRRAVSMFYHLAHATWEETYHDEWANMTLMDYATLPGIEENWMVRSLSNRLSNGEVGERELEHAKVILRDKCLVGFMDDTEALTDAMDRFEKYFGWNNILGQDKRAKKCHDDMLEHGVNGAKYDVVEERSPEWEALAQRNQLDIRLYEYAKEVYEEQGAYLHDEGII